MLFYLSVSLALLFAASPTIAHQAGHGGGPIASSSNGTVKGRYLPEFNQDLFLGVPFADAPRLDNPRPRTQNWTGSYDATAYGTTCYGFGSNKELNLTQGEDCLNLNVVRPHGYHGQSLPVLVWMYGGGFTQGSNADPMWNLSYIVQTSVENHQPIIAVSINYRLSFLGFPVGIETLEAGVANLALKDQRISLQWIQENIAAFGGDREKVTIWGESAGGASVGWQLVSYGGTGGKGLFRAAVMHSGTMLGIASPEKSSALESQYQTILNATGCTDLECLRQADITQIYDAEATANGSPVLDGEFFNQEPALDLEDGNVHQVPVMIGANQDEGLFFENLVGVPATKGELKSLLSDLLPALSNDTIDDLLVAYSLNSPAPPYSLGLEYPFCKGMHAADLNCTSQYRRTAAILGDCFEDAPRRYVAAQWSKLGLPTYSFRFAADPTSVPIKYWTNLGPGFALHGADLAYDFRLPGGFTTPIDYYPPVKPVTSHEYLSKVVASKIISFAHSLDPNSHHLPHAPNWPLYDAANPRNYVYNVSSDQETSIHVERDDYRKEGMDTWLNHISEAYYNGEL